MEERRAAAIKLKADLAERRSQSSLLQSSQQGSSVFRRSMEISDLDEFSVDWTIKGAVQHKSTIKDYLRGQYFDFKLVDGSQSIRISVFSKPGSNHINKL